MMYLRNMKSTFLISMFLIFTIILLLFYTHNIFKNTGWTSTVIITSMPDTSSSTYMPNAIHKPARPSVKRKDYTKKFLYIVNSDKCIRDYLAQKEVLGDSENLDVLIMSYNSRCENSNLTHVKYIFGPNTSWGTGRNLAWTYVQENLGKYLYYIYMDEDLVFKPTLPRFLSESVLNKLKPNVSILRQFEDFLLETQPTVAAPFHAAFDPSEIYDITLCCQGEDNHNKQWNLPERLPMIRFDACFAAFHNKAIGHIMPLDTRYDATSWFASGRYLHMKSYYYFHRQLVRYTPMTVYNPQHKSYPQETIPYANIIKNIKAEVPETYRNATIFTQDLKIMVGNGWIKHIDIHPLNPAFQLAPVNDEIVPFKYINSRWNS